MSLANILYSTTIDNKNKIGDRMCTCIKDIPEAAGKSFKEAKKDIGIINKVDFKHYGFSFGENPMMRLYNEIEYSMTNKKKDGTTGATKNHIVSIYHTYCPFCGQKHIID